MKRFELTKKQQAAIARFEKASQRLAQAGVELILDGDEKEVYAFAVRRKDRNKFDCVDIYDERRRESNVEDVTDEVNATAKRVSLYAGFVDGDSVFIIDNREHI